MVNNSCTWISYWKREDRPSPFSDVFIQLMKARVLLLFEVLEGSPEWFRGYPTASPSPQTIAVKDKDSDDMFVEEDPDLPLGQNDRLVLLLPINIGLQF